MCLLGWHCMLPGTDVNDASTQLSGQRHRSAMVIVPQPFHTAGQVPVPSRLVLPVVARSQPQPVPSPASSDRRV
jgi:hypothetical protein